MAFTFLVTGASSGLGLDLALTALQAGHKVIATARNPKKAQLAHPQLEQLGGEWLQLDVSKPDTERIVKDVVKSKNVNVVVNNAGYALISTAEDMNDDEARAQMDTNFFGALKVIKGAIPSFRNNQNGVIVNVSSIAGLDGLPACGLYSASKFAMEGLSESLSRELAPFNIRVLVVEPGAFRTNFQSSLVEPSLGMAQAYNETPAHTTLQKLKSMIGKQPGDPKKGSKAIVDVVTGKDQQTEGCLRLLLGADCIERATVKANTLRDNIEKSKPIAMQSSFN